MKKIYAIALFLLTSVGAFAQHGEITSLVQKDIQRLPSVAKTAGVIDTITDYIDRSSTFYILGAGASGYVFGTNNLTYETGMHYDAQGAAATISELMVYFVHKETMGATTDIMTAGAYMVNPDSTPNGTPVASGTFSVDDVDTSGFPTFIPLTTGTGLLTGDFMVTINYDPTAYDDTLVILANSPVGDGNGEKRAFQRTTLGWMPAAEIWTFGGNPLDGDALICPIVDVIPVGIEDGITTQGLTLKAHYPNPTVDFLNIPYSVDRSRTVRLTVFDQKGRILADTGDMHKTAGDHEATLKVSDWSAGKYYYRIQSEGAQWTSRFVVTK